MKSKLQFKLSILVVFMVLFLFGLTSIPPLSGQTEDVEKALFQSLQEKFDQAKESQVHFYAPKNYQRALELFRSVKADFKKGAKLSRIRQKIRQATRYLDRAFEITSVSKDTLENIVKVRDRIREMPLSRYAPREISRSENHFNLAIQRVEKGDTNAALIEAEKAYQQYRLATIKWLKNVVLEETENNLKAVRRKIAPEVYDRNLDDLKRMRSKLELSKQKELDPFELRDEILTKIKDFFEPLYPPFYKNLPETLLIGEFVLAVDTYTDIGQWDFSNNQAVGVSGTAWMSFQCGVYLIPFTPIIPEGFIKVKNVYKVVSVVTNPDTQISIEKARLIRPDIKVGQDIKLELAVEKKESQFILLAKEKLLESLKKKERKGDILLHFDNVTITEVMGRTNVGRIIQGKAAYPTDPPDPEIIELSVEGFTVLIDALTITPAEAVANINLQFPPDIASTSTCEPVSVDLGKVPITPDCEFYVEDLDEHFGPWIVGDIGMHITGTGKINEVDFSSSQSPPSKPSSWKGVVLKDGTATGNGLISDNSNTGYLAGKYTFSEATVTNSGFATQLSLSEPFTFYPIYPVGYTISVEGGTLNISESRITSGQFGPGRVVLPTIAVCKEGNPGDSIEASFSLLTVQDDLDLAGQVSISSGTRIGWGELTHPAYETVAWKGEVLHAYLYIPAGPVPTFSPDTGTMFLNFSLSGTLTDIVMQLESQGMTGVTLRNLNSFEIYSPDRPGGTTNPIKMGNVAGWLNIGSQGVNSELQVFQWGSKEDIGDETREGYVGRKPFDATLTGDIERKKPIVFQFATSAVYDSEINGSVDIPEPCNITDLQFADMEVTSTANLVGGDIMLPVGGVTLDYWQLGFEPTGDPSQAGVVSARTGRLVFTAAGISEYVHFDKVFSLNWCEMFADGNLGDLYIDYNSYGQRFDGLSFSPSHLALSEYKPGDTDSYLAVCGTVHFNYFGSNFVNIRDARYDTSGSAPYYNRYVTCPKTGEAECEQTDLHLHGEWDDALGNGLAVFDFPDAEMKYNEDIQEGFIGTGSASISFIKSDSLDATIEVHRDAIDICFTAKATHDVDFGLIPNGLSLSGISELYGCARIEGPQLERIAMGGYLEQSTSVNGGVLAPKSGFVVEVNISTTPNSCTFYASGDLLLSVAASAVDISGFVFLGVDFTRTSAEGNVEARIDCNSVLAGLSGEGQVTWYTDPSTQYFQGMVSIEICSWTGGVGLEGGIFIGHNVPKEKAWVLETGSEHFGVSSDILPNSLTGLYGYGQISFSVQWYIFGGGVELYAGMGAFSEMPSGLSTLWSDLTGIGLPYVIGSCGIHVYGEILGGVVSASAWADLDLRGPAPIYYEGTFGLEGCVLWVICAEVEVTAGLSPSRGFYMD